MQRRATKLRLPRKGTLSGARARHSGRSFESAIIAVNAWYDRQGEAAIEKVNAPTEGWGRTLRMFPSNVDFLGTWRGVGPAWPLDGVAFDAKGWTGKAAFGIEHLHQSKEEGARHRARFLAQVAYLKGLEDRHRYFAFFLLHDAELDAVWLCDRLDTLGDGGSVLVRTIHRATNDSPRRIEHHLPHITVPNLLALAAAPRTDGRPHLDYLSLLTRTTP